MFPRPVLTAMDDRIYGETPEDGIVAKVYGNPELATLFAAAPELLEALESAIREIQRYRHAEPPHQPPIPDDAVPKQAFAAIAKARGL